MGNKKKGTGHGDQANPTGNALSASELEREQEALKRKSEGLIGDTGQNRNLTGSSTWDTLPEPSRDDSKQSRNRH